MGTEEQNRQWMRRALDVAERAIARGEVPVGAVVIGPDGEVVAEAHDAREHRHDPTAHAEILALRLAGLRLGGWNLEGCTLVVTLEPCAMCAGAAILARIDRVVYGAPSDKCGACGSVIDVLEAGLFNHTVQVTSGPLAEECSALLTRFFETQREPPSQSP
ncbi:nucleoside deaminase [Candidatus Sumerlaeota bacterium]|nr:nucleoside deaminase [Candidatus Sumerlaeota bacterium]